MSAKTDKHDSVRLVYDAHWTEIEYSKLGGRDFLGIETLSEGILADLLPGINNQTRRARYYSFWAWVLRDFIRDDDTTHTQAKFYLWLRRRETALILAYLAHGCGSGAAGTEQGYRVWGSGEQLTYPLGWKSLRSVEGGSYQLYYRGALREMNIVRRSEDSPHDDLTKPTGVALADAYGEAVAETKYARDFLDATFLRREDIEDFAQVGCLCRVADHEAERRALIDAFFRFDTPDTSAVKRLASLCFFLDAIDQSAGLPLSQTAFRTTMYFWSYGDHHQYHPEGNLVAPASRWRILQLRQFFVYAVESLWSIFLDRVEIESLTGEEYISWVLDEMDLVQIKGDYGLELASVDPREVGLKEIFDSVRAVLPDDALLPGPAALMTELNEQALTQHIRRHRAHLDVGSRVFDALLMMVLMYWRCQSWRGESGWIYASRRYAAGRMPIDTFLSDVEDALQKNWGLARWLGTFYHRHIWLRHRRVVLEKLVARGQDTSLFELVNDAPDVLDKESGTAATPRMRGIGKDVPKMNAPRFPSAFSILSDLRVVESTSNNAYRLSTDGKALLKRFRGYQVPTIGESESDEAPNGDKETASR